MSRRHVVVGSVLVFAVGAVASGQTKTAAVDLAPGGVKATILAPEGAAVENAFGDARIAKLPRFSVDIAETDAGAFASARDDAKTSRYYKAKTFHTDSADLILWESETNSGAPAFHFYMTLKVAGKIYKCADTRPNVFTRADVDAMIAACRSLKMK